MFKRLLKWVTISAAGPIVAFNVQALGTRNTTLLGTYTKKLNVPIGCKPISLCVKERALAL